MRLSQGYPGPLSTSMVALDTPFAVTTFEYDHSFCLSHRRQFEVECGCSHGNGKTLRTSLTEMLNVYRTLSGCPFIEWT